MLSERNRDEKAVSVNVLYNIIKLLSDLSIDFPQFPVFFKKKLDFIGSLWYIYRTSVEGSFFVPFFSEK